VEAKYPVIAAAVSAALANATAQPLAIAADSCTATTVAVCSIEPPPPTDNPEHHPERATVEHARGEQAPATAHASRPRDDVRDGTRAAMAGLRCGLRDLAAEPRGPAAILDAQRQEREGSER
jgi:hypothetical protein